MFHVVIGDNAFVLSWQFAIWVLIATVVIRIIMTTFRTVALNGISGFWAQWYQDFLSTHPNRELVKDFWVPSVIGTLELAIFPFLISSMEWRSIGGWIAIKTAVGWKGWTTDRSSYNRFLLGNALVIFASLCLTPLIKV